METDLAAMAEALDRREREVMMESGEDSPEFLRYMAEESGNVAADGNFSIQVLSEALQVWSLSCLPIDSPEASSAAFDPQHEQAFICHLQSHWFTIRKVQGLWYNFNSLYAAPEFLSQFYLSAYLATLKSAGWTIFTVRGDLPPQAQMGIENSGSYGRYFTVEEAKNALEEQKRSASTPTSSTETGEDDFSRAINASLGQSSTSRIRQNRDDDDADLVAAIAASLEDSRPTSFVPIEKKKEERGFENVSGFENVRGNPISSREIEVPPKTNFPQSDIPKQKQGEEGENVISQDSTLVRKTEEGEGSRESLAKEEAEKEKVRERETISPSLSEEAVKSQKMSTEEEKEEEGEEDGEEPSVGKAGVLSLALRLPKGQIVRRRFYARANIASVLQFVKLQGVSTEGFGLSEVLPGAKIIADESLSLEEAGIKNMSLLQLKRK